MKQLIAIAFTTATLLTGTSIANAGITETQAEIGFKYPADLTGFKYPDEVRFQYPTNLDK